MKNRELTLGERARERAFGEARGKVLDALLRTPLTAGEILARPLRGTGFCLPSDRDELVAELVDAGEIVLDPLARREDSMGRVTVGKAYRLTAGKCRACGCTDERGCEVGCHWVEPDLCSACVGEGGTPCPDR